MSSPILYHGPASFDEALIEAHKAGRLLCPPVGQEGLKKDEARSIVEITAHPPIGDQLGVVVIGPMDLALPASSDVLLKTLEDGRDENNRILLWAYDLEEVRPTVRSRCLPVWCGGEETFDDDMVDLAKRLLEHLQASNVFEMLKVIAEAKSKEVSLLRAFVGELDPENSVDVEFWSLFLRPLCGQRRLTQSELITPFVRRSLP